MIEYFSNAIKNERIVTRGQAVRALLISIPIFVLFLIVTVVIVFGIVVLAGFVGQGGHGNPGNTEFFNSVFDYAKIFGLITFLSSLAVIRAICLCIGAECQATYGKTNIAFFIVTAALAAALLLTVFYFTYLRPTP